MLNIRPDAKPAAADVPGASGNCSSDDGMTASDGTKENDCFSMLTERLSPGFLSGVDLENIVYYKDDTHYFVMTAKKQSLLEKGVILHVSDRSPGPCDCEISFCLSGLDMKPECRPTKSQVCLRLFCFVSPLFHSPRLFNFLLFLPDVGLMV